MERVNIYLPKQLRQQIQMQARRVNRPQAEVIRELLEKGLEITAPSVGNPLLDLVKIGFKGGPPDLSTNLDDYLYGDKE